MKKASILAFIIFLLAINNSFAQVIKLRSTSYSIKHKSGNGIWGAWSEPEETSVLIVIDSGNERITVYSKETQVYDVIDFEEKYTDNDGDNFWPFFCVDADGLKCWVKLAKLNSQNGRNQLYVSYSDMAWVYNVYGLD